MKKFDSAIVSPAAAARDESRAETNRLRLVIPKGRLHRAVVGVLNECGVGVEVDDRVYVPRVADPDIDAKLVKPQNIPQLVEIGAHDAGFCGLDWVRESGARVDEVLDLGFDPVRIVAAVPEGTPPDSLAGRTLVVASEYENLTRKFLEGRGYRYVFLRTYGATEVFPPDDADMIIDNVASGRTLGRHRLQPLAELMSSSTWFIANPGARADPWKREKIAQLRMLLQSVLDARERVMLEMNVPAARLADVVAVLPCMRSPTVARLFTDDGYSVKAAVPRAGLARLLLTLKGLGAGDILETEFRKVLL